MNPDQIKALALKATKAALRAYVLRPDKPDHVGRDFTRGFGNSKAQKLAIAEVEAVLMAEFGATADIQVEPSDTDVQTDVSNAA